MKISHLLVVSVLFLLALVIENVNAGSVYIENVQLNRVPAVASVNSFEYNGLSNIDYALTKRVAGVYAIITIGNDQDYEFSGNINLRAESPSGEIYEQSVSMGKPFAIGAHSSKPVLLNLLEENDKRERNEPGLWKYTIFLRSLECFYCSYDSTTFTLTVMDSPIPIPAKDELGLVRLHDILYRMGKN
ncbi:MAG: hypothetical protein HZB67_03180 [Candidatus Aenigmarchaeota archaeon]|nr:hypothetical protein [Candidatus Aenigmarchaeota archaeon]